MVRSEPSLQPGSIADIAGRLTLWARRNPQGLVRVEYSSEFARQEVLQQVQVKLAQLSGEAIAVTEVALLSNQAADAVVADLLQQLEQVATDTPHSVVSITGFATAFRHQDAWPDALRVVNFNRDRFAALPLRQIWWFTPAIMQTAIHAMPDLNSWFSQRLQLTESVAPDDALAKPLVATDTPTTNLDDARQRAQNLVAQFHQARQAGAPDAELLKTYLLPALEALAEASAQRELRNLAGEFEGWLGRLKLDDSTDLAYSLDRLARIYEQQGRYREALPLYRKALKMRKQQLGVDHPQVATSLNNLAGLYYAQGRYGEAEPLYQRSLQTWEEQLGANHPDVATSLNNLAALYESQGRYGEAEPLYQRSLQIREQQLGADHANVATTMNDLANLYHATGRYKEAEPLLSNVVEIYQKQLGEQHPWVATSLNNLAALYQAQGRDGEAEPLYQRSLQIREKQLGADHPDVAASLNNLAELYRHQGRDGEAEPLYQRSLRIWEKQLGADHPDVAINLNNLALLYQAQGRYGEAEPLYMRAIEIGVKTLPAGHPKIASRQANFAGMIRAAVAAGQTEQLSDHPTTQAILQQLREE